MTATKEDAPPKVINLMDALRKSLDRVSTDKKKAVKATGAKSAKGKPAAAAQNGKKRAAR